MRLPWWGEGPAVGLSSVMLQLPFRMLGTKLLWWTWHDTDPTIEDRMFWTPWSSLYFYAACACSFVWMLRLTRRLLLEKEYDWMKFPKELTCSFLTGVLSYWLGTAQFALSKRKRKRNKNIVDELQAHTFHRLVNGWMCYALFCTPTCYYAP
ncbi:unnamed protein product [Cylicocyclus nassatus]|uniref:DUF7802 domain-containing protein n=1 Tax=Cylicocyclus nassatus TaxID=53992 RepID=A0AA36H050_CYLNA|nr:unnamed protein product [Cylicocyclus nassatus]